jgi:hypothetical protein
MTCNSEVHYRIQNSPRYVPILSHMPPVHVLPLYFFKIHVSIIFPSTRTFSKCPRPFRFVQQNPVCTSLPHTYYMPLQSYTPWFDTRITADEQYKSRCSSIRNLPTLASTSSPISSAPSVNASPLMHLQQLSRYHNSAKAQNKTSNVCINVT